MPFLPRAASMIVLTFFGLVVAFPRAQQVSWAAPVSRELVWQAAQGFRSLGPAHLKRKRTEALSSPPSALSHPTVNGLPSRSVRKTSDTHRCFLNCTCLTCALLIGHTHQHTHTPPRASTHTPHKLTAPHTHFRFQLFPICVRGDALRIARQEMP